MRSAELEGCRPPRRSRPASKPTVRQVTTSRIQRRCHRGGQARRAVSLVVHSPIARTWSIDQGMALERKGIAPDQQLVAEAKVLELGGRESDRRSGGCGARMMAAA